MSDITALAKTLRLAAESEIAHRAESDTSDLWQDEASPENILALVEALEKAQKSNQFLKDQLSELANFNPDWDKLEASYESWREIAAELLVAKDRIAELESRIVTVKLPEYRNSPDMHTKQYYEVIGFNLGLDACVESLAAAGISKGE
ncbi:TPA: hypothetical protein ACJ569_004074 [Kluyvera cryocrescens]